MTVSTGVQKLIGEYQLWQQESLPREDEGVISVDEVVARVASFYETIRGIVDWREEHLLRKTAIERILKRRLAISRFDDDFAENFLSELVRGGHFPNKRISYEKVDEIQAVLEKYVAIIEQYRQATPKSKKTIEDWIFSIAATEIEEALSLPRRERALIELMSEDLGKRIQLASRRKNAKPALSADEKALQIYVAVHRALYKLDNSTITYHIFERFYEDWKSPSKETIVHVAEHAEELAESIQTILVHPYGERFYQIAEKYDTPYLILGDILADDLDRFEEMVANPIELEHAIRQAYERRLAKLKGKITRAAFYSTISVFVTKILVALAIEIPFEQYVGSELNYLAIGLNVGIPPLLMLALVTTVQTSSKENFGRVMVEAMKIIQVRAQQDVSKIFPPRKPTGSLATLVYGLYVLSFLASFGILVWILGKLQFSIFSTIIFMMFVSLVLFAATKIRQRARELMVEPVREGFLHNLFDIFSLPMIQVGRWLSGQLVKYNILLLLLNFLIEVPFQMFVEFLEQWRNFLREKKEEIH